jgi:hypothetical protein
MSGNAPFSINPTLSAIAIAYQNRDLVADGVLPYLPDPVATKEFKYTLYTQKDTFTVPDTKVGRRGKPNVVEFGGTDQTAMCQDYGLDDEIPQDDIDQAANMPGGQNLPGPEARSTELVTNLVLLDREVRVAGLVFSASAYAAANKTQLSGTSQWSDYVNSDPVAAIGSNVEAVPMRPNVALFGAATWATLRSHPKIVKAVNKTAGDTGLVSRQAFADVFELDEVIVGGAFYNTANKGQTMSLARVWGKHALFFRREKLATRQAGVTFGYSVRYGQRIAGSEPDRNIGLRGGQRVRVGESVKELITAADAAFFFQDAVA